MVAPSSPDLADLFNRYGSDKDVNGYSPLYQVLLQHRQNDPHLLLEIGIGTLVDGAASSMAGFALEGYRPGGSLRAWRDWMPNARIVGADVQPDTQFSEERIETYLCDSTNTASSRSLLESLNARPDIIIDDGSHLDYHQIVTLRNFFEHLKPGGLYIIEDIYPGSLLTEKPDTIRTVLQADMPYFFVGVKNNLCVIQKTHLNTKRRGY